ncbi:MAG: hypothetical protein ACPGVU_04540 [Limisphaerales bacterium]
MSIRSNCFLLCLLTLFTTGSATSAASKSRYEWKPSPTTKGWLRVYVNGARKYSFSTKSGSVTSYDPKTKKSTRMSPADVPMVIWDKMKEHDLVPLEDFGGKEGKSWRKTRIDGKEWAFSLEKGIINQRQKTSSGKYQWKLISASRAPKMLLTTMKTVGAKLPKSTKPIAKSRKPSSSRTSIFPQHVLTRYKSIGGQPPATSLAFLKEKCKQSFKVQSETGKPDTYGGQSISYRKDELILTKRDGKKYYVPLAKMDPTRVEYEYFPTSDYVIKPRGFLRKEIRHWDWSAHQIKSISRREIRVIHQGQGGKWPKLHLIFKDKLTAQQVQRALVHFIKLHRGKGEAF